MSKRLRFGRRAAAAASVLIMLVGAEGSGAVAQTPVSQVFPLEQIPASSANREIEFVSQAVVQPLADPASKASSGGPAPDRAPSGSLHSLVSAEPVPSELSSELNCLAGAIYFEAKGETLEGQLAVGRVIVARSKSGRFPASYCGVVYQRSQFSFVRGKAMPAIDKRSRQWANAVRIARIAHEGSWQSPVEGALFFHAAYVSPGWQLKRMARIDNHVFYR